MSYPLQEKGHWDLWAPGKVAATGIQVRDTHAVRNTGYSPREVFQKTEDIFTAPTPTPKYTHKSLKGSTILFSVVEILGYFLKTKPKRLKIPKVTRQEIIL